MGEKKPKIVQFADGTFENEKGRLLHRTIETAHGQ